MVRRHTKRSTAAVAAVMTAVVLAAEPAVAATALSDYAPVTSRDTGTYPFTTRTHYWSAVGLRPAAGVDYDLTIRDPGGASLGLSTYGSGVVDFVAIDSNLAPLGDYQAVVSRFSGSGSYDVMLAQGEHAANSSTPTGMQAGAPGRPLAVNDIYLRQGQRLALFADKVFGADGSVGPRPADFGFFLLASTPGSYYRSRAQAMTPALDLETSAQWCKRYSAPRAGWYGIVMTNTRTDDDALLRIDPTGAGDLSTCPG
ncbi:MAG: hypothetical protein QOC94_3836 [Actinoplanes sp.]|jgi:hypothetical protein|nr:hypothetical protein [Actinoplanes sp.]